MCSPFWSIGEISFSWLPLNGEVFVVRQVDAVAEQALDQRRDELEVHEQRDVDVSEPPRVVVRRAQQLSDLAAAGPGRRRVADVEGHGLRGRRISPGRVRFVVFDVAVRPGQAAALWHWRWRQTC